VLIGLPALRVRGINLAVVTIGAAVAIDSFVFQNSNWSGGLDGLKVPEPKLFGWSIDASAHPERFGGFALVVLLLCVYAVCNLRRSKMGRRMLAVRDNERAAAGSSVAVSATKLQAFAFSSFIAALAGVLLAYQTGTIAFERFAPLTSVLFVAVAFIGGIASVSGALVAGTLVSGGIAFTALNELGALDDWQGLISGLLLIVEKQPWGNTLDVTRNVEKALEAMKPALAGMKVDSTIFRPATFIERALRNLSHAMLIGCGLVIIILAAFLFDWRTALISMTAIPLSLVAAALVLHFSGATMNTMVIAGLVIALGEVVDDAIIDVENILRRLRLNKESAQPQSAFRPGKPAPFGKRSNSSAS